MAMYADTLNEAIQFWGLVVNSPGCPRTGSPSLASTAPPNLCCWARERRGQVPHWWLPVDMRYCLAKDNLDLIT